MAQLRMWGFWVGLLSVAACTDSIGPIPSPLPRKLAFSVQPGTATAGVALRPLAVTIQDASGKTVTSATNVVTVALDTNAGGGTLVGTVSVAAVHGVATFSDLHLDKASTGYTLTATASGLTGATSALFDITPGAATKLVFAVQPNNAIAGAAITPAVQVAAQDAWGNTATAFSGSVTVAIGTNPAAGTITGTVSRPALNGVAGFSDLHVDKLGTGYTLTAAATGLAGAVSPLFDIAPEPVIVFSTGRGIEGIQPDGSGRVVLIADPAVSDPAWSPDGAMLAFSRRSADYYTCEIYTARADGSGAREITSRLPSFPGTRCARTPSWSPDGTKIAFGVSGQGVPPGGAIDVAKADGSDPRELLFDSQFGYPDTPKWSPDGTRLAFDCWGGDITLFVCIMNADGSGVSTLTPLGGCEWGPAWSPDGSEIAFVGTCENGGPYTPSAPYGIWLKHPDGAGARNLTDVGFGDDESPAWSPDGTQLVFARGHPADLYIINRDGTGLLQLTSTPDISETSPAWRPAIPAAGASHLARTRAGAKP